MADGKERAPAETGAKFELKRTSEAFLGRCRDVFAGLPDNSSGSTSALRNRADPTGQLVAADRCPRDASPSSGNTRHLKNRESIFRISDQDQTGWPLPPAATLQRSSSYSPHRHQGSDRDPGHPRDPVALSRHRQRRAPRVPPDHVLHPERYTKYSLADTPGVSNQSNARAALDFLQEIRARKGPGDTGNDDAPGPGRDRSRTVTFRKPPSSSGHASGRTSSTTALPAKDAVDPSGAAGSSRRVLPEVKVGLKAARSRDHEDDVKGSSKRPRLAASDVDSGTGVSKPMRLSHLDCLEDDEA